MFSENNFELNSSNKCPIPLCQQPLYEYQSLKHSCFFSWPTLNFVNFILNLLILWFVSSVLVIPIISNVSIVPLRLEQLIILDITCSSLVLFTCLARLYLGWSYVLRRLLSAIVFYEESGWYDGQIWIKSSKSLTQDRLIGTYNVMPLINIIKKSLTVVVLLFFIEIVTYFFI